MPQPAPVEPYRESALPPTLGEEMRALADSIREKAFSLFQSGVNDGDVDDWLRAERDVIWSPAVELDVDKVTVALDRGILLVHAPEAAQPKQVKSVTAQ